MINTFKVIVSGYVHNDEGQLLVIKRADHEETFPGMYAIPGGTVESAKGSGLVDDTIENALIREIKEETDVDVKVVRWLESSSIAKQDSAKLYLFFACKLAGSTDTKTSDETPEVFWADVHAVDLEKCTPSVKRYIENLRSATKE